MKNFLIFISVVLVALSCKKDTLPEIINSTAPVYSAQIELNGETVIFNAGDNDLVMLTSNATSNDVSFLEGSISDGSSDFTIQISDGNLDKLAPTNFVARKQLPIYISNDVEVFSFFKSDFENSTRISEVSWYVNDAFYALDDLIIEEPGKYKVCAFVTFLDGTADFLCNDVIVGYKKNAIGELQHYIGFDGKIQAWINSDTEIEEIKWFLNESLVSSEMELISTSNTSNSARIKAEITYANGVMRTKQVLADLNQTGKYIQDFSQQEIAYTRNNDFGLNGSFTIDGEEYTTNIIENANIPVSIQYFANGAANPEGEATYKVSANTECFVQNINTGEIINTRLNFTLAVAAQ